MKTKNEFQGNKGIKALHAKNLKNGLETIGSINVLLQEELMQIKGGDEFPVTGIPREGNDFD